MDFFGTGFLPKIWPSAQGCKRICAALHVCFTGLIASLFRRLAWESQARRSSTLS